MGMFVLTGLGWFGVRTNKGSSTQLVGSTGSGHHAYELFGSFFGPAFGIKLFAAVIPLVFIICAMIALKRFTMTKADHTMIRAAIAVRKKYGAVALTDEQIKRCEAISGQRYEDMWISSCEEGSTPVPLELDANGKYTVFEEVSASETV